ncbi:MAG: hypothetical protein LBM96_04125 [Methanobrevibacter sp.]|jgi:hypothetical protein|nr:hypothetical protein [Candidatus Methanoflexus mossambicus]
MSNENLFNTFIKSFNTNFLKTITTLSKSKEKYPRSVVKSNIKLLSGDDLKKNAIKWNNKNNTNNTNNTNKINDFSSVDGIFPFYDNDGTLKLLFIEFKHILVDNESFQEKREKFKKDLKLKPLETLNCVLPHLIDRFCNNPEFNKKEKELISYLFNCPKAYICVINYTTKNKLFSNNIREDQDVFDIKKLSKHPFDCVKIMNPNEFIKYMELKDKNT